MPNKTPQRDPLWYPFTQMKEFADQSPISIANAEGNWLIDADGQRYLDGVSSLWANVHGHRHPTLDEAIQRELANAAHTTMLGSTHPGAIALGRRLVALAPHRLTRVFYSESGSTAVEIALKMAYQHRQLIGQKERTRFIKLGESYHGDTIGSVSVGGIDLFHDRFSALLFETARIPTPDLLRHPYGDVQPNEAYERYLIETEAIIEREAPQACAIVVEPLIQGAAGMIVHPEGYYRRLRELADRHDLTLIADEVAVGFGRTGKMFASEWENVSPDLMCLGKGITGGYLPLAATLASEAIFDAFLGDYAEMKTFFHGHTYTGNRLACAAALANLDVFENEKTLEPEVFGPKAKRYAQRMQRLADTAHVGSTRFRGLMGGAELFADKENLTPFPFEKRIGHRVCMAARNHGVMVRPLGDVLILLPPLSVTLEEIDHLFDGIEKAIGDVLG